MDTEQGNKEPTMIIFSVKKWTKEDKYPCPKCGKKVEYPKYICGDCNIKVQPVVNF